MYYAGFWNRFIAAIIDSFIIIIVIIMIAKVFHSIFPEGVGGSEVVDALMFSIVFFPEWFYFSIMESSSRQGTLGKILLGIKVTDLEGGRISFWRATARFFGKIPSSVIFGIGFFMAAFTKQKQALHDMMAGCLVVRKLD